MIEKYVILNADNKIVQVIFFKTEIIDTFPINQGETMVLADTINIDELEWYSA